MNAYLVVIRYIDDDIPFLLTYSKAEAIELAARVKPTEWDDKHREIIGGDDRDIQAILGLDATQPVNASVYEFVNGKLVAVEMVSDYGDQEQDAPSPQ